MSPPLPIMGLHHVAIVTRRPDESRRFYCEVLGFRELERPPFNFRGSWLYNYGFQIHLIENQERAPTPGGAIDTRAAHLAFAVNDVDAVVARLEAAGVPYRQQVNAGGIFQTFFHDPDGNHIEVATYPPPPKFVDPVA